MGPESRVKWVSADPAPGLEQVRDLLDRTLPRLPSLFGQLVSVASSIASQKTTDHIGAVHTFDNNGTGRALREAQRTIFVKWLCLSLEEQKASLESYASWLNTDVLSILKQCLLNGQRQCLVPEGSSEEERRLFLYDLDLLLKLAQEEPGRV